MEGNLEVVHFLLLRGASPHVQDKHGQSPLNEAIRGMNEDVIKLLREAGAHLGPTTVDVVMELCCLAADDRVDMLRAWYLAGVDFNVGDYDGRTALHVVSGVDVHARDTDLDKVDTLMAPCVTAFHMSS